MAYDNIDMIYHLTPNGWNYDDTPPDDRVETWNLNIYQASGWSKERRSWSLIWESAGVSKAERDKLRANSATAS